MLKTLAPSSCKTTLLQKLRIIPGRTHHLHSSCYMMKSLDQRKHTESNDFNDIMYRRMKNRERQRRYRERKRLAADTKSLCVIVSEPTTVPVQLQVNANLNTKSPCVIVSEPTTLPVQLQLNGNLNGCVGRVHCRRDWKKDARRAHAAASKGQEDRSSGSLSPSQTLTNQTRIQCLSSGAVVESSAERELQSDHSNCETRRSIPGRRDWKAAARNKKSANG